MATYIYREDCGEYEARFKAADDDAAEKHAEKIWRAPWDPHFDGDSARLFRIETDEDGEYEVGVFTFDGVNMVLDVDQMRDR